MPATRPAALSDPANRAAVRLFVNIDHVATVRQARRGAEPDPVAAARWCEDAGAHGITAHLREDRRHVQDHDIERLRAELRTPFNLEMADTDEMVGIAIRVQPEQVTLVPERRTEVTTEGGLHVVGAPARLTATLRRLREAEIQTSLFIDPEPAAVRAAHALGADAVELHTGRYSHHPDDPAPLRALAAAAQLAAELGLAVYAGHGLTVANVGAVARLPQVTELNIGHSLIARSIAVGLPAAVQEMLAAIAP